MVCSRGKAPTQSQLIHFQRANVALSRARDQCVLVRSLDISDVPSIEDMKIPIIEFFLTCGGNESEPGVPLASVQLAKSQPIHRLLARLLTEQGYGVRSMGVVWKNGICVEHPNSDMRAALMVDCSEESLQDWHASYRQQKAIERVGWKCLRVDVLSLLTDCRDTLDSIIRFLSAAGVEPPTILYDELEDENDTMDDGNEVAPIELADLDENMQDEVPAVELVDQEGEPGDPPVADAQAAELNERDIVVISSDDEYLDAKPQAKVKPEPVTSASLDAESDEVNASNFGYVVDLAFLRGGEDDNDPSNFENGGGSALRDDEYQADQSDSGEASCRAARRRRKYRRLEKYQRDGRWNPNRDDIEDDSEGESNH
jgi:hypothetical protein